MPESYAKKVMQKNSENFQVQLSKKEREKTHFEREISQQNQLLKSK